MFIHSLNSISQTQIRIVNLIALFVFPRVERQITMYGVLPSSAFLFDLVDIKGKISTASYKTLIPLSVHPSRTLIHIFKGEWASVTEILMWFYK